MISLIKIILLIISKASSAIMQIEKWERRPKEEEEKGNGSGI